jgi:hypothetical protein
MGTSDCALFFFETQDIVPAGKEDTPLKRPCQMRGKVRPDQALQFFLFVFHLLIAVVVTPVPDRHWPPCAEIPVFTRIRFVANPKMTGPGLVK